MTGYRSSVHRKKSRRNRIFWIALTAAFLTLAVLVMWVWVKTKAGDGYGAGRVEHYLDEPDADEKPPEEYPAVLVPAYPSPFRPLPEGEAETKPGAVEEQQTDTSPKQEEIVYHSRRNDRMEIALSFDDGPHPRLTPVILDILKEYGIKATFFMVGENVEYYPDAARAVAEAGHEIGNHTFSHRKFSRMSEHEMLDEIHACEQAISSVTETPVHFIRPPEGQMNEVMRRVIGTLDYRIILWDVDTRDWAHTPPTEISRHILDTVQAGDIILMHDFIGHSSPTPEALRTVIPALLERGYRFVTVGELVAGDR
ncbi:MAG: polysaccharide deacetylase family protein [Clostridia bacterium]|nr:polysaccharide deacetylase family protein [Clostridia bacterium]